MLPHETSWLIQYGFNRPHQSPGYLAPTEHVEKALVRICSSVSPMSSTITVTLRSAGVETLVLDCQETVAAAFFLLMFRLARQAVSGEDRRNSNGKLNPRNLSPFTML